MSKRWYVVHAYSGFEKSVQRALLERIARAGMQDKFGQILVPVEEVVEMKSGQKSISERKFFPGYVLVEMEMTDESWHLVKNTAKVTGFIGGTATRPTPISEKEVQNILNNAVKASEHYQLFRENMTEEELVIFDILTRPAPELSDAERAEVKKVARELLARLKQLLVLNWRQKAGARAQLKLAIEDTLDTGLPRGFDKPLFEQKCSAIFEHVYESYPERELEPICA